MKLNIIGSYMPANDRQSNIELLRIVAMSMIVIGHFLYHGVTKENMPRFLYELLYTYCRDGVNLFFLISGFFRIKSTVKSVARLVFTVLFSNVSTTCWFTLQSVKFISTADCQLCFSPFPPALIGFFRFILL